MWQWASLLLLLVLLLLPLLLLLLLLLLLVLAWGLQKAWERQRWLRRAHAKWVMEAAAAAAAAAGGLGRGERW